VAAGVRPAIAPGGEGFAVSHHYGMLPRGRQHLAADSAPVSLAGGADIGVPRANNVVIFRQPTRTYIRRRLQPTAQKTFYRGRWQSAWTRACARQGCWWTKAIWRNSSRSKRSQINDRLPPRFRVTQTPTTPLRVNMPADRLKIADDFDLRHSIRCAASTCWWKRKKMAFADTENVPATDPPTSGEVPLESTVVDAYADECSRGDRTWRCQRPVLPEPEAAVGDTTYFCVVPPRRQRGIRHPKPETRALGRCDGRRYGVLLKQ